MVERRDGLESMDRGRDLPDGVQAELLRGVEGVRDDRSPQPRLGLARVLEEVVRVRADDEEGVSLVVEEVLALPPDEANLPGRLLDVVVVGSGLAPHDRGGRGGEDREEEEERDRSVRHRSRSSSRCGSGK